MGTNILTGLHYSTVVNNSLAEYKASFIAYKTAEAKYTTEERDEAHYFAKVDLLGFFISQICWVVVLWIVKCSIIAFYWRLFSGNGRSTRIAIGTIAVAVMFWGIAVVRSPCLSEGYSCPWRWLSRISYKDLVTHNNLPMFSYRWILGTVQRTEMQGVRRTRLPPYVYGLYGSAYCDRRCALDISDATSLETSES